MPPNNLTIPDENQLNLRVQDGTKPIVEGNRWEVFFEGKIEGLGVLEVKSDDGKYGKTGDLFFHNDHVFEYMVSNIVANNMW